MLKAVLVDDEQTTLNGLANNVNWTALGIELAGTALNGEEGLASVLAHRPDIIVTDVYMPVMDGLDMLKQLRLRGVHAEVLILSGYEDFQYVKTALKLQVRDYMCKPATIDEIESVLKETAEAVHRKRLLDANLPLIKRDFFRSLLQPGYRPSVHAPDMLAHLSVPGDGHGYAPLVLEYHPSHTESVEPAEPAEPGESSRRLEEVRILGGLVEQFCQQHSGLYNVDIHYRLLTFIHAFPCPDGAPAADPAGGATKALADRLLRAVKQRLNVKMWGVVGVPVRRLEHLHDSYREAMNTLSDREQVAEFGIVCAGERRDRPPHPACRPMELYLSVAELASLGQRELLNGKLAELTAVLRNMRGPAIGACRDYAAEFAGTLAVTMFNQGLPLEQFHDEGHKRYRDTQHIYNADDLCRWIAELAALVCNWASARAPQKHKKTVDYIIRFVNEHYAEDITLDTLSGKLYLTRNYLSHIFKQATGENYNSYLTRVRMEKAKQLIASGRYRLYEISEMVGYKNNAYFSQLFKKHTGSTPSEFNP